MHLKASGFITAKEPGVEAAGCRVLRLSGLGVEGFRVWDITLN